MSTILKSAIKPGLKQDILAGLREAIIAEEDGDERTQQEIFAEYLSEAIAQRLAVAVQSYLNTNVQVQVTVAPGITVATAGTPVAQTGTTTSPGTGAGRLLAPDPTAISLIKR